MRGSSSGRGSDTPSPRVLFGGGSPAEEISGKRVLVVGLGRTGLAVARFLNSKGVRVTVSDSRPPAHFQRLIGELVSSEIAIEMGQHEESIFCRQDLIVVSPGVDLGLGVLESAREQGVPVVSEIEIAGWFLRGRVVGITGSNGKTTTTTLLGEILSASGFAVQVGGNIGTPLISQLESASEKTLSVVELSSFQLEAIDRFRPHMAVLLNLTPDHLDRHGSLERYEAAKGNIFRNQGPEDCAVLNADDPRVMKFVGSLRSRLVLFSRRQKLLEGVFVEDGEVVYRTRNLERVILSLSEIPLLGPHNLENVLAAVAAAATVGADLKVIPRVVARFKAVEHRLEFVRELKGVKFYNDSKATNVDATAKSISAFEGNVLLILGGKEKGGSFRSLRKNIEEKVKGIFLVGAAAERIGTEISGVTKIIHCGELTKAVHAAFQEARRGDTVLLAPACASFDQFENFEHRGRVFKEAVSHLAGGSEPVVPAPPPPIEVQLPPEVPPPAEQVSQPDSVAPPEAPSLASTPLSPPPVPEVVERTVKPGRIQLAQMPPQSKEIPVPRKPDPSAPPSEPTSTVLDGSALTRRTAPLEGEAESAKAEAEQAQAERKSAGPFSPQTWTGNIRKKKKHKRRKRRR